MLGNEAVIGKEGDGGVAVQEGDEVVGEPVGIPSVAGYEAAAVEFDVEWVFAWFEGFGDENADFDGVAVDVLVRCDV